MRIPRLRTLFVAVAVALGGATVITPAATAVNQPTPGHASLVPDTARKGQPRITNGEIWDIEVVGDRVYVAGSFTSIRNTVGDTSVVTQPMLAAWNHTTGQLDMSFRPVFDGSVRTVEASPDGSRLYVGGTFRSINGVSKKKLAQIDPTTGAPIAGFKANGNAQVNQIAVSDTAVYAGGRFTAINGTPMVGLAAVDPTTGAVDTGFDNQLSGGLGTGGTLTVQGLKLTPDNSTLIVAHTGRRVADQDRTGVAMIDTASKQLLPWRTRIYDDNLPFVGGIQRIYAMDVSPDGSFFAVGSGSGGDRPPLNDTVLAFDVAGGDNMDPRWITRNFDSVYSVGISEQAVYIGGHFNFTESQNASDPFPGLSDVGYGTGQGLGAYALGDEVVRRDHIAALDPANGKALEWNPGSNSFEGNKAMEVTPQGLFTGGDGMRQGGVYTGRVAFYDLDQLPAASPTDTRIDNPVEGYVVPTGTSYDISGAAIVPAGATLRRVQIEIINANGRYLQDDRTSWGGWNTINADLGGQSGAERAWSVPVTFSSADAYTLRARAVSSSGRDPSKATKKFESFSYDDQPPQTSITGPGSIQTSTTFEVTGTATDDNGVQAISYLLRDADNLYLQDDGTMAPVYNAFRTQPDVIGAPDTTWRVEIEVPSIGTWRMVATAIDTAGQPDTGGANRIWTVDPDAAAPEVTIAEPAVVTPPTWTSPIQRADGAPLTFTGTATDASGLAYVEIRLQNTATLENLAADGTWGVNAVPGWHRITPLDLAGTSTNWSWTTPFNLSPGRYAFRVRAVDDTDLSTPTSLQGRLNIDVGPDGDAPPDTQMTSTDTEQNVDTLHLDVDGTATDDVGVAGVRFTLRDRDTGRYLQPDGTLATAVAFVDGTVQSPGATSTPYSLSVDLPSAGSYTVRAIAVDTAGQYDINGNGASRLYLVYPGDADPYLNSSLAQPTPGQEFTEGRIVVSGRAEDDTSIGAVQVVIQNPGTGEFLQTDGTFSSTERWLSAFLNSPGSPGSNYSYTSPVLPTGDYLVRVRAVDTHDQVQQIPRDTTVTVTTPSDNQAPTAVFSAACTNGNNCTFDGRASTDENATSLTFAWDLGDGRTATGPLLTTLYTAPGTYPVTLVVSDEFGVPSAPLTSSVTITEPPDNVAPVAVTGVPSCAGLRCNVNASASSDPNLGDVLSYQWDYGDGSAVATLPNRTHTYPAAGTYTLTLTVTDGWGRVGTAQTTVTVTP
ncbi:MAG: PKD domain-containing protein [Actinomycetales bacterium]